MPSWSHDKRIKINIAIRRPWTQTTTARWSSTDGNGLIARNGRAASCTETAPRNALAVAEAQDGGGLITLQLRLGFNVVVNAGTLTVHNSAVTGSILHNILNSGTLTVLDSTFCCEVSDVVGGGIFDDGKLVVQNSTFSNSFGGGIFNAGEAVIGQSSFVGNQWPEGNRGRQVTGNTPDNVVP